MAQISLFRLSESLASRIQANFGPFFLWKIRKCWTDFEKEIASQKCVLLQSTTFFKQFGEIFCQKFKQLLIKNISEWFYWVDPKISDNGPILPIDRWVISILSKYYTSDEIAYFYLKLRAEIDHQVYIQSLLYRSFCFFSCFYLFLPIDSLGQISHQNGVKNT